MHEIGFQFSKQAGNESAFPAKPGQHFEREFTAWQQVERLIPGVEREGRGDFLGAGDPVEVVVRGVRFQFSGNGRQPGGMVAGSPILEARERVDREVGEQGDAHGGRRSEVGGQEARRRSAKHPADLRFLISDI